MAIIGPSGSGKSTLLRSINYIEPPTAGTIRVGDVTVEVGVDDNVRTIRQLRSNLGMVFQSFNLFPHMTVLRNVALPQERVLKRSRKRSRRDRPQSAEPGRACQQGRSISGSLFGRTAAAHRHCTRTGAGSPKVMLFDEPTSALDPELAARSSMLCANWLTRA